MRRLLPSCCRPYRFAADPFVTSAPSSTGGSSEEPKPKSDGAFEAGMMEKEEEERARRAACVASKNRDPAEEAWLRAKLVYRMASVVRLFGFTAATLHLAVEYLDRFRSRCDDPTVDMRVAATTCVWIAAKFNESRDESWCMSAAVCAMLTHSDANQVIRTEMLILRTLDFVLVLPTVWTVAHALCDDLSCKCSPFWMNLALMGTYGRSHRPSVMAAAAVCATHETESWTEPHDSPARDALARRVGCSASEVEECVRFLRRVCDPASPRKSGVGVAHSGLRRTVKMHALADADTGETEEEEDVLHVESGSVEIRMSP